MLMYSLQIKSLKFFTASLEPTIMSILSVLQSERESRSVVSYSMEFSRPEYWTEQPFPSPGNLPNPRTEPRSPALQADSLTAEPQGKPMKWYILSLTRFCKTKNETPKTTAEEYN